MSKFNEASKSYSSCTVVQEATKILSSLRFLDPSKTCEVEKAIVETAEFKVICLDYEPTSGKCICAFELHVNDELYAKAVPWMEIIEEHLTVKSLSVLKYFPQAKLSKVEIKKSLVTA